MNAFDVLKERGFLQQISHEDEIRTLLGREKITFYVGFDPTADSLHIGHFLVLMGMAHMQRAGHRPICLIGGGTTMIGDPTGKQDMRKMLDQKEIEANGMLFQRQMERFIRFDGGKALLENNAHWLAEKKYMEFLREVGGHFSVHRMVTAECFQQRMKNDLSLLEFNYMLMQAGDFLELYRRYGCILQMGGNDQWSNMLEGADLIRRKEGKSAYSMTFTLLTTRDGKKMGKTEKGALWLDRNKTLPADMYRYWLTAHDDDVKKYLLLLTFLPIDQINRLTEGKSADFSEARKVLAREITQMVHGRDGIAEALQELERDGYCGDRTIASR